MKYGLTDDRETNLTFNCSKLVWKAYRDASQNKIDLEQPKEVSATLITPFDLHNTRNEVVQAQRLTRYSTRPAIVRVEPISLSAALATRLGAAPAAHPNSDHAGGPARQACRL